MQFLDRGHYIAARYVGNRPNPLCWNDPFLFQQGIEAIGCEVLERLNFPGRPADLTQSSLPTLAQSANGNRSGSCNYRHCEPRRSASSLRPRS